MPPWLARPSRSLVAAVITGYQRHLSPRKGFCCAYRYHTGGMSCSEYARRMVLRRGVLSLWTALPRQFARCKKAHQSGVETLAPMRKRRPVRPRDADEEKKKRENRPWWERWDCSPCDVVYLLDGCGSAGNCHSPCDCSP